MAKTKITTIGPDLLRDIRWAIDQTRRLVRGDLQAEPPPPVKAPDDYIVLTPPGGIPEFDGYTLKSASCAVYKETATAPGTPGADKILAPILDGTGSAFQLPVYNIWCEAVPGNMFVPTALLKSGTRYVLDWRDCTSSSSSDPPSSSPSSSEPSSSPSSSEPSSSPSSSEPSSSEPSSSEPSSSPSSSEPSSSPSSSEPSSSEPPSSEPPSDSDSEEVCSGTCVWTWQSGQWIANHTCIGDLEHPCACTPAQPPSAGNYENENYYGSCQEVL